MQFSDDDRADGSSIEDRRGSVFTGGRVGAGVGGMSVLGLVAYVLMRFIAPGADVSVEPPPGPAPRASEPGAATRAPAELGGSCKGVTSESDPAKFIACVETNVQAFWRQRLEANGQRYQSAPLVLFTQATESGCGVASAATGPFYCPPDGKVFLDLGFFRELHTRFGARGGDFAQAYVVAHEYGHHVQDLVGTEREMRRLQRSDPGERNALSVKLELQADCYAGVWGHAAYEKGKVSRQEISQALDAAAAVGDDRIQKEMRGTVRPETFTHGSAAERQRWFEVGMESGDPARCDTFGGGGGR